MDEIKKVEVKNNIIKVWDKYDDLNVLAKYIEQSYIFGPLGSSEHYNIDEIFAICEEVNLEKNPLVEPTN